MKSNLVLVCNQCQAIHSPHQLVNACTKCGSPKLTYKLAPDAKFKPGSEDSLWRYQDLLPGTDGDYFSDGEGNSPLLEMRELSEFFNGAKLHVLLDSHNNPTGTFKDREAALIINKAKASNMDNLVFYSTANTGRAYTHYAASLGLKSFCFLPASCSYKNTANINKNPDNYFIFVGDSYPKIAPFAKEFATANNLTSIGPMHDRTESYTSMAYEQFEKLPQCTYFAQTIASGMGVIGYFNGQKKLVEMGLVDNDKVPKIISVQSSQTNHMAVAYNRGDELLDENDLPGRFRKDLFEPTLNSTNPVRNFPSLKKTLDENQGIIIDVTPEETWDYAEPFINAMKSRGFELGTDVEKSALIEFAGLRKLASQGVFDEEDQILFVSCGRKATEVKEQFKPDAIIDIENCDPVALYKQLTGE